MDSPHVLPATGGIIGLLISHPSASHHRGNPAKTERDDIIIKRKIKLMKKNQTNQPEPSHSSPHPPPFISPTGDLSIQAGFLPLGRNNARDNSSIRLCVACKIVTVTVTHARILLHLSTPPQPKPTHPPTPTIHQSPNQVLQVCIWPLDINHTNKKTRTLSPSLVHLEQPKVHLKIHQ